MNLLDNKACHIFSYFNCSIYRALLIVIYRRWGAGGSNQEPFSAVHQAGADRLCQLGTDFLPENQTTHCQKVVTHLPSFDPLSKMLQTSFPGREGHGCVSILPNDFIQQIFIKYLLYVKYCSRSLRNINIPKMIFAFLMFLASFFFLNTVGQLKV